MLAEEKTTRLRVGGMDCAACGTKIETAVRRLPGIEDASVSVASGTMSVRMGEAADLEALQSLIRSLGYSAAVLPAGRGSAAGQDAEERVSRRVAWWRSGRARLTAACGGVLLAASAAGAWFPTVEHAAHLGALAIGLVPVARRAVAAARSGTPFSIEMLMSVAAVGAVAIGATGEAATVVFLFLVGEVLEGVAAGRARASIEALSSLVPRTALLLGEGGQLRELAAESLAVGAVILVRPGDRMPADGVIVAGEGGVDEASVTGESTPRHKREGDDVYAGSVNGESALRVQVVRTAADNTIARVVRLVEEAQDSKAPTARFVERFARWYTPAIVAVAALVAITPPLLVGASWSAWIYKGLAVLLIGCPCALVISTPAAIAAALSSGARRGLLLKGGAVLERLGSLTVIAFDKTGTLTEGRARITDVIAATRNERQVLSAAAALEAGSSHPLAAGIIARAREDGVPMPPAAESRAIGGKGVVGRLGGEDLFFGSAGAAAERAPLTAEQEARVAALNREGKTVSVLVAGREVAGLIAMRDEPREDARAGLDRLAAAGVKTIMLTGDNARTAQAIGDALGIEARGDLLPEDKMRLVSELQRLGERVGKVGDGINDAPALAAADVGIAMGGGTDVALETAEAAVLHGRVSDVAAMVDLSRRTMRNIHQNISLALGLKAVFLGTTIAGITGLWPAILADTGATVLVTANALRLLRPAP